MKPQILRRYEVAELEPESLSEKLKTWLEVSPDPFVCQKDGLMYISLESLEDCEIPGEIQEELNQICELVGFNRGVNHSDYTWWIRVDLP